MHLRGEEGGRWSGPLAQHVSRFGIKMLPYPSFLASFLPRPFSLFSASPACSLVSEDFQHPTAEERRLSVGRHRRTTADNTRSFQLHINIPPCSCVSANIAAKTRTVGYLYFANSPLSC